ncbi:MAG: hypothetical protein DMG78_06975 [Acidobacteria bacterium]|nr:MAG: hypothetical protein DMG78_06975 [Acidobacteriota bacterium]
MRRTLLLPLISIVLACSPGSQAQEPSSTLKKVGEFDLPGPHGKRFDYLTIDSEDHYLISAHLAAGQTYVIDLRTNKVVATVADTPGAEGVEYVSELKKFYTSNAGDNTIGVRGLETNESDQKAADRTQARWKRLRCALPQTVRL